MPFDRDVKVECGCLYVEDAGGMWNNIRLYGSKPYRKKSLWEAVIDVSSSRNLIIFNLPATMLLNSWRISQKLQFSAVRSHKMTTKRQFGQS